MRLIHSELIRCDAKRLKAIRAYLYHCAAMIDNILESRTEKTGLRRFKEIEETYG